MVLFYRGDGGVFFTWGKNHGTHHKVLVQLDFSFLFLAFMGKDKTQSLSKIVAIINLTFSPNIDIPESVVEPDSAVFLYDHSQ